MVVKAHWTGPLGACLDKTKAAKSAVRASNHVDGPQRKRGHVCTSGSEEFGAAAKELHWARNNPPPTDRKRTELQNEPSEQSKATS